MSPLLRKTRSICPVNCTLEVIGDRWSLLIIRDMVFKEKKTYKEFLASQESISTNILADRLKRLKLYGIIDKSVNPDNAKQNFYSLTEKGLALIPLLVEMFYWGATQDDTSTDVNRSFLDTIQSNRDKVIADLSRQASQNC